MTDRKYTRMILDALEQGVLNKDVVLLAALNALSEDDVEEMAKANDFVPDEDDDSEDDGQPSEHDEWMSFDPDC
jgi:hypothetical protein